MFVNKPAESRTVDEERGVELRHLNSGPERPEFFVLTVTGTPIGFKASVSSIKHLDGQRVLVWTVHDVGVGSSFFVGPTFYQIPAHRFTDVADREAVLSLIDEALRVYRSSYGLTVTPVEDVVFEAAAKGA